MGPLYAEFWIKKKQQNKNNMKTISTLLCALFLHTMSWSQVNLNQPGLKTSACEVVYSANATGMVYSNQSAGTCTDLKITSLPNMEDGRVPVRLAFTKGTYTLQKGEGLLIPDNIQVEVEDLLTGQIFDLKDGNPYTFNVNRNMGDRFMIYFKKQDPRLTASR